MIVFKRRLIFWLIKAYLRKWGKVIFLSFISGLVIFFILFSTSSFLIRLIPIHKNTTIGIAGPYTSDNLPMFILNQISTGLTTVDESGNIKPGLATDWNVTDKGHTYTFHIDTTAYFSDGHRVTSGDIIYNFADVKIDRPDDRTMVFHLKEVYAPFLVTVSRPILIGNSVGVGKYKILNIQLNGTFIQSLTLASVRNKLETKKYVFYLDSNVLKTAFLLGEIGEADALPDTMFKGVNLSTYPNTTVQKDTRYSRLVTLFYNTQDESLSDNRIRSALSYAVQDEFPEGERAYLPYPPQTWYFNGILEPKTKDITHAKLLMQASGSSMKELDLKTLPRYLSTAKELANDFKQIGLKTKIEEVDSIPSKFQMYLGDINLPQDPDQYALWHENQGTNISLLIDKRIDKYLEDGRQTLNLTDRKQIYDDFQKYLIDRAPATFLYFPYSYSVVRK